ncbi:MAG: VCBS repeat-containing protein [Cytophagales bacterium]|uniref:FG-GAP repeat domain-containing protein n=1 Tax=Cyclobacterium marinum TaxID=104 RepID=UPI0030D99557|nr:VCBS repeat-containing protein [Cytophagales bacterium]|tara:strand:- start:32371 stop:33951 length:1581 start_codon:yes stop_codon:yes gene_type:complete
MRIALYFFALNLIFLAQACNPSDQKTNKEDSTQPKPELKKETLQDPLEKPAEMLAKTYCTGCHLYPEPDQLDKTTWQTILPRMGHFFGIYESDSSREDLLEGGRAGEIVERSNVFPKSPTIDPLIFDKIKSYYLDTAPEKLPEPQGKEIKTGLKNFKLHSPAYKTKNPMHLMVKIIGPDRWYISDAGRSSFSLMNNEFKVQKTASSPEGTVWVHEGKAYSYALVIGTFNPTDMDLGFVMRLPNASGEVTKIVAKDLQRPVHMDMGDLDGDGLEDMVIAEYGKNTGSLGWWKQGPSGKFQKIMVRNKPGATKAYIRDLNNNGLKDIIALFGQGDEGIYIFHNQGNGKFAEEPVLRFPPTYGSSFFDLYDFNGDGFEDIIYTAGDNADYDPIAKPYHGIRVYINDGTNHFKESFFYPLNGAYKAIPSDFDNDGDIDIAAISFFPDYENSPEESFVYLENKGDMNFDAFTFSGSADGRWMAMDAGDMDGDGDLDLLLGSMIFGTDYTRFFEKWSDGTLPFAWLENTSGN